MKKCFPCADPLKSGIIKPLRVMKKKILKAIFIFKGLSLSFAACPQTDCQKVFLHGIKKISEAGKILTFKSKKLKLTGHQAFDAFRRSFNRGIFEGEDRFIAYFENKKWVFGKVVKARLREVWVSDSFGNTHQLSNQKVYSARVSHLAKEKMEFYEQQRSLTFKTPENTHTMQKVMFFTPEEGWILHGTVKGIRSHHVEVSYTNKDKKTVIKNIPWNHVLAFPSSPKNRYFASAPVGEGDQYINVEVDFFSYIQTEKKITGNDLLVKLQKAGSTIRDFVTLSQIKPFRDGAVSTHPQKNSLLSSRETKHTVSPHSTGLTAAFGVKNAEGKNPYTFLNKKLKPVMYDPKGGWIIDLKSPLLGKWMRIATQIIETKTGLRPHAHQKRSLREHKQLYRTYLNHIVPLIRDYDETKCDKCFRDMILNLQTGPDLGFALEEGAAVCLELSLFGVLLLGEYGIFAQTGVGRLREGSTHAFIQTFDEEGSLFRIIDSSYTQAIHKSVRDYLKKTNIQNLVGEYSLYEK